MRFKDLLEGSKFISTPDTHDDHDNRPYLLLLKLQKGKGSKGENAVRVSDGFLINLPPQAEVEHIKTDR